MTELTCLLEPGIGRSFWLFFTTKVIVDLFFERLPFISESRNWY